MKSALENDLQPILCIGETLQQRENHQTHQVLEEQISKSLQGITSDQMRHLILAYEPVWAIGTGKTATPGMAQEMHSFCRQFIAKTWGIPIAEQLVIQYGGSVKPENAKELMDQPDIDGLLIGGASLSLDSFVKIVDDSY